MKPGAPSVNATYPKNTFEYHGKYDHQNLRFGDVEAGFAQADVVLEDRYQMSPIEHAPTETNGSIAVPDTNGRFIVHTSTQALFFSLDTAAKINAMPSNQLHFIGGTVGGGFGGKVDTMTEPLAVLAARLTGAPVRYRFSRHEEMQFGSPRGGERIYIKDGVMRDGRIVARHVRCYFDSGAYTRLSSYAAVKCAAHIPGPYTIPNVSAPTSIASSPTARRRPPCAASASPRSTSRSNARWTSSPTPSAWIRSSSAFSTPIATAT